MFTLNLEKICIQQDQDWYCYKSTLERQLKEGAENVQTFPCAVMTFSAETGHCTLCIKTKTNKQKQKPPKKPSHQDYLFGCLKTRQV